MCVCVCVRERDLMYQGLFRSLLKRIVWWITRLGWILFL